ncbi:MAG: hypothetical protein DHS80DRAFT_22207 [Piptocephalis tieghemiana]|nr:MAG: hypothetical protein DHS80DRAFT_22207 [Piptocephalis tieghemiana]
MLPTLRITFAIGLLIMGITSNSVAHPMPDNAQGAGPQMVLVPVPPALNSGMHPSIEEQRAWNVYYQRYQNQELEYEEARQKEYELKNTPRRFWKGLGRLKGRVQYDFEHLSDKVKDRGQSIKENFRAGEHSVKVSREGKDGPEMV